MNNDTGAGFWEIPQDQLLTDEQADEISQKSVCSWIYNAQRR